MEIYNLGEVKDIFLKKDVIIFDFDGVLVDSVRIKTEAFSDIYSSYGNAVQKKVISHHKNNGGMSRYDKFKHYHKEFLGINVNEDALQDLSNLFSKTVVNKIIKSQEVQGASKMLSYLKSQNLICAIASAAPEQEVIEIVNRRGWNNFFKYIYGSPNSKVANIESILNKTKCKSSKAIFFGDSPNDLIAAKKCNIDFIPINYLGENNNGFKEFLE